MKPTVRPNDWWADEGRQGYGSPMWWPGSLRKCLIRSASNHERLIWPGIRSFADTAANGELAPIPAVGLASIELVKPTEAVVRGPRHVQIRPSPPMAPAITRIHSGLIRVPSMRPAAAAVIAAACQSLSAA